MKELAVEPKLQETAQLAVQEATQDLPVHPETQADPATLVLLANLEIQANHLLLLAKPSTHHHANHALQVLLAHPANPVNLATPDKTDNPENLEETHNPDLLDQKAHLAHLETLVPLDNPETLEPLLKAKESNLDLLDHLEMLEHLDNLANPVNPETMDNPVALDPKAHPAHLANQETPETTVNQANPDNLEVLEKRVSARNTAPSMVVFSSKMELADKQCRFFSTQAIPTSQLTAISTSFVLCLLCFESFN
jgi:hypothetical protein